MADEGIFATTAEVIRKAGAGASSTAIAEDYVNDFIAQAESLINTMTRFNWSNDYTNLDADKRDILKMAASAKAGMLIISFDMKGYTSRFEAQLMLDVLRDEFMMCISILRQIAAQDFVNTPA